MQSNTGQGGNQNTGKQGGLSWTQSPSNNASQNTGGAKPISQVSPTPVKTATASSNNGSNNTKNGQQNKKSTTPSSNGNGMWRSGGIFIAGVLVGLIVGWAWFSLGRDTESSEVTQTPSGDVTQSGNTTTPSTSGSGTTASNNGTTSNAGSGMLSVSSSQAAGMSVAVSNISVSVPTWVVVFESSNGKIGNALGAKLFFPTEHAGTVELLRGTTSGATYYVGEYIDNGDHVFSKHDDTQVNDITGSQKLMTFTTR